MKTKIFSIFALMLSATVLTACSEDSFGPDPEKGLGRNDRLLQLC